MQSSSVVISKPNIPVELLNPGYEPLDRSRRHVELFKKALTEEVYHRCANEYRQRDAKRPTREHERRCAQQLISTEDRIPLELDEGGNLMDDVK